MKAKVINVFLVLSLFVMVSCGGGGLKAKLAGTWEVTKVDGKEINDASMTFAKEGTFEQKSGNKSRKGKYEVDEKAKTITLKPEEGDEEKMTDVKVEKDVLTCKDEKNSFEFKKK
jgi:hypothetical protein